MATTKTKKLRGYSRNFPTTTSPKRVMLTIDRIPPKFYTAIKAKAKKDGVSLRSLVLTWFAIWLDEAKQKKARRGKDKVAMTPAPVDATLSDASEVQ